MRDRRARWTWAARLGVAILAALTMVGASLAQNPPGRGKAAIKPAHGKVEKADPLKKGVPNPPADPLADPKLLPPNATPAPGTFHYRFKFRAPDGTALTANYYPSKLLIPTIPNSGTKAPVLLMVHEKNQSSKDFEDPISELKGQGLAEHMQGLGYAVLTFDLRGHGANVRGPVESKDWKLMIDDLQAAYVFLLDRHNRGELNLGQLGVLGIGEGANLVAAWAASPGGAIASEGQATSDIAALVLISPMGDGEGLTFPTVISSLTARFPLMIMVGETDTASGPPVRAVKAQVERTRLNQVELFPSKLHGYKLLRLEPKVTSLIVKFFEKHVQYKTSTWAPRYNLAPVPFIDVQMVRNTKPTDAPKARDAVKAKDAAAPVPAPAPAAKAKEKEGEPKPDVKGEPK